MPPQLSSAASTSLTISNPLVLYRSLLATRIIDPDPAQHRLALELQKLYLRLKDYSPKAEYGARLRAVTQAVEDIPSPKDENAVAAPGHPLRRNPLFAHLFPQKPERDTLALTRILTSHDAAMNIDSPKGMLLHGEVGTGKSMLIDLLADSLPNRKKRRWHFNTFMLETLARLEQLRQSRSKGYSGADAEHSLVWLAKDMVEKTPILFLDEFQLPDRAASKILSNLFTAFFQLGGVLIATSNRMPDELAKASGTDFAAQPKSGLVRGLFGFGSRGNMSMFPANDEYGGFVEVLKARCEIWNMEGGRDYRRRETEETDEEAAEIIETMRQEMIGGFTKNEDLSPGLGTLAAGEKVDSEADESILKRGVTPKKYLLTGMDGMDSESQWQAAIKASLPLDIPENTPWNSTTLQVFGRKVPIPRYLDGVTRWSFAELCGGMFGPADYITMASTFHTFILDDVPILTLMQKNEARRLITLLDALYEARCKLLIRAEAGPDDLFFPETKIPAPTNAHREDNDGGDAVYPETLSEIYQDQTSPFRPNVSTYTDTTKAGYDPDEDSDFGPLSGRANEHGRKVDFGMTNSFTGEDERFAYKRARSRLWEMCGARWHARSEPGWWRPLPTEVRRWERSALNPVSASDPSLVKGDVKMGESIILDRPAGLQGKELEERERIANSSSRNERDPPPEFGVWQAWGITKWGKKAGAWGQGVEGLEERKKKGGS
ncbi:hypothetical protein MBM_05031 [Drepanopeziza brunnea f. sp. 'multigermtubi' MB_m1]|uniref:AAA+ ATPase domain-containing protein n=1 Tax=Marssonina brunnea f. sp. multigermtubi (strain MB_m1) TaxID=1072389 RepID=K1WVR8_MARBU|nr:uncharacterized protein MBM_05031 [Drepanopeziza brunnea f. sp. 'multigermtubi' MB_m1]EKD16562.1 hypothetical protein MBM_05031 [Drepanopeziza brunnea f. sp. 'multigermtubi' MB_m1]